MSWGQLLNAGFGSSCSISGKGEILAISSPIESKTSGTLLEGKVRLFTYNQIKDSWEPKGNDLWGTSVNNNFGIVSMSSSGNEVAVSTPNVGRGRPGQVWIFRYSNSKSDWEEIAYFEGDSPLDYFGQMIMLSPDGNGVAIVAPRAGNICIYKQDSKDLDKSWTLHGECIKVEQSKSNDSPSKNNYLLFSIALSESANRVAIGIPPQNRNNVPGKVKVYELIDEA